MQFVYLVYKVYRAQPWERRESFGIGTGQTMVIAKSSQKGLKDGWTRATFILRKDYLEKIKASAYWKRKNIKEVMDEALGLYLRGKKIKPRGK
jgi:uncharacterized protein YnzC (UPF0291/DUF896 family)